MSRDDSFYVSFWKKRCDFEKSKKKSLFSRKFAFVNKQSPFVR